MESLLAGEHCRIKLNEPATIDIEDVQIFDEKEAIDPS